MIREFSRDVFLGVFDDQGYTPADREQQRKKGRKAA
jgi:hypothetical protein